MIAIKRESLLPGLKEKSLAEFEQKVLEMRDDDLVTRADVLAWWRQLRAHLDGAERHARAAVHLRVDPQEHGAAVAQPLPAAQRRQAQRRGDRAPGPGASLPRGNAEDGPRQHPPGQAVSQPGVHGPRRHLPAEPGTRPGLIPQVVRADQDSDTKVAKPSSGKAKPTAAGGFNVEFEKMGVNEKRAKYDRDTRTIYINLEHPRIAVEVALTKAHSPVDDPNFMRMAYEIAFTEYAIVLAQELSSAQYYFDPQDALVEVRQTLDDLSKAFATVWRSPGVAH